MWTCEIIVANLRTMDHFEELSIFVAIARAGSISKAAEQRNQAKSVLSRRLSELEARLGAQLITRTTRSLTLTDAGQIFLRRAERILDELSDAECEVKGTSAALSGRLRVAAPLSYGLTKLKPILSKFIKDHHDLKVEIDFSDRKIDLVEDGFDVALRIGVLTDSSLIARKVTEVGHSVAASPEFWKRHGRPEKPEDLADLDYLQYMNAKNRNVLYYWGPGGVKGHISPPTRVSASNGDFLADLAADGCGFMIEPNFILEPYLKSGALEAVLPQFAWSEMNLYLVYPPTRRIAAKTRAFSEAVIKALGT